MNLGLLKLFLYRIVAVIPLLLLVSILAFSMVHLAPGGVAETLLGSSATPERVAELNAKLGLDRPFLTQYGDWLGDAVHGNFGNSYINGRSVSSSLWSAVPVTFSVALGGLFVSLVIGVTLGIWAALRAGSIADRLVTVFSSLLMAVPSFWVGMLLAFWVGVRWGILPSGGYQPFRDGVFQWAKSLVLPSLALGLAASAQVARQMRNSMIDVLGRDYIRTAQAKGVPKRLIVRRHALRNAASPVATVIGFQLATMLGGSFVIERVFALPGIGNITVTAVLESDIPVVLGVVMVTAVAVVTANLFVDVLYGYFDPRVRPA